MVCIEALDAATPVPFGEYRLSSLKLEVPDSTGLTWTYYFFSDQTRNYSVPTGKETTITLLEQPAMNVSLGLDHGKAAPGQTLSIQPKLTADGFLYLSRCEVGKDANFQQAEGNAEILLLTPDGKVVNRGLTGFS